jgi:hypothetical protein
MRDILGKNGAKSRTFLFLLSILLLSGCIRLVGKAGYVKQTPEERTVRTYGFDTADLAGGQKTQGSITT